MQHCSCDPPSGTPAALSRDSGVLGDMHGHMAIPLKPECEGKPIWTLPRPHSAAEQVVQGEKCTELAEAGIIAPCPDTMYASDVMVAGPALMVFNRGGSPLLLSGVVCRGLNLQAVFAAAEGLVPDYETHPGSGAMYGASPLCSPCFLNLL